MLFVFLHVFCVWMFLFFDHIFSITLPPVHTLNPIGKNVSMLRFSVSFLLKDTRGFENAKGCLFDWFVSFFKFCFLNSFILTFLHQFASKILCSLTFLSQIWGFILCKESFRAWNCRDIQLCFIFLRIRIWFPKLPAFLSKQAFSGLLLQKWSLGQFLTLETKCTAVFFWICVILFFSELFNSLQNLHLFSFAQGNNQQSFTQNRVSGKKFIS